MEEKITRQCELCGGDMVFDNGQAFDSYLSFGIGNTKEYNAVKIENITYWHCKTCGNIKRSLWETCLKDVVTQFETKMKAYFKL